MSPASRTLSLWERVAEGRVRGPSPHRREFIESSSLVPSKFAQIALGLRGQRIAGLLIAAGTPFEVDRLPWDVRLIRFDDLHEFGRAGAAREPFGDEEQCRFALLVEHPDGERLMECVEERPANGDEARILGHLHGQ